MCGWLVGMAKIYCDGRFVWTAGYRTDHRNKNGFVWKLNNGVSVPLRYTNWMRNEPNNWRGDMFRGWSKCLGISPYAEYMWTENERPYARSLSFFPGKWHADICTKKRCFVCAKV